MNGVWNRKLVRAAAGASALVVAVLSYRAIGTAAGAAREPSTRVKRYDLILGVEITGVLRAAESDQVGAPPLPDVWEYRIATMAPEGGAVKKGDVILTFDTNDLVQKLEEKKAERDGAAKQIEKRQLELDLRKKDLEYQAAEAEARKKKAELKVDIPENLAKANELQQTRLDLALAIREVAYLEGRRDAAARAAKAELESLAQKLERAKGRVADYEDRIARMTVRAPRDGTVLYLTNWRDEKKKVGDSCWRGEQIMEVPNLEKILVKGEVDEAEVSKLREGEPVSFRLEAHPDVTFNGRLVVVGRTVTRQSPKVPKKVVKVDVALDTADPLRMRPGMRVRGSIETARVPKALLLALETVFPSARGPIVYRATWRGFETAPVKLGRRNEKYVEVLGGLREGDAVLQKAPESRERG